jgi:hypothetical protein
MKKKIRSIKNSLKSPEEKNRKRIKKKPTASKRKRKKSISTITRTIRDYNLYVDKPSKKPEEVKQKKIKMTATVYKDLLEKLRYYADRKKITVSEAINRILKKQLKGEKTKK